MQSPRVDSGRRHPPTVLLAVMLFVVTASAVGDEPTPSADALPAVVTLADVTDPGRITAAEPIADVFSAENAARYLDTASLHWQKSRRSATCHTNMVYLYARPALSSFLTDSGEVRKFFEEHVTRRWKERPPRSMQATVVVASGLTFNDLQTTGKLSPVTRQALQIMWKYQRDDGGWTCSMMSYPAGRYRRPPSIKTRRHWPVEHKQRPINHRDSETRPELRRCEESESLGDFRDIRNQHRSRKRRQRARAPLVREMGEDHGKQCFFSYKKGISHETAVSSKRPPAFRLDRVGFGCRDNGVADRCRSGSRIAAGPSTCSH